MKNAVHKGAVKARLKPSSWGTTLLLWGLLAALPPFSAAAREPEAAGPPRLVDRLLAVVDDDPIFLSDLRRARAMQGVEEPDGEPLDDERLLAELIDRRLRLHEVDRHTERPVERRAVDEAFAAVERRLGGALQLDAFLAGAELDRRSLRELLRRRLRVLAYVEERLGARIFIDEDDVQAYYDGTLKPEMERRGAPLPPLVEVTAEIRAVLYQQALNHEIETWTDELHRRADIQDLSRRLGDPEAFPPVVRTLRAPKGDG